MAEYAPPVRDIRFVLDHVVDLDGLTKLPEFTEVDLATVHGLLDEYGRFVAEVLAPLDRVGDTQGSRHDPATGAVRTPDGFADAYRRYVEAGWGAVSFPAEYGGGGFPSLVAIAMAEMLSAANMALSICILLSQGAIDMLDQWGDEEQQERYLRRLVSAEWTGTMNLTEPDAGSDVGALRTKAEPAGDGSWRISGTKIFISWGEHDLAENIVHLVLARVPDAPPGTRGISCFIVPKFLVADDGSLGKRNGVTCVSIEHKLGIHASPTCVLSYDGAVGYLVGEPNAGMRYMFTMMNQARLSVGIEGVAIAERSYQSAHAYAAERRQGRAPSAPAGTRSPIVDHADVRSMLLTMRALVEAMRIVTYTNAWATDMARHHADDDVRRAHQELVDLLTPISKGWCTDVGTDLASVGVQVHGGMGYIEETGVAQHLRDVRAAAIYEGTNGIQAIDLVTRKLPMRDGQVVADFITGVRAVADDLAAGGDELAPIGSALDDAAAVLADATGWIAENGAADLDEALAAASPYLRLFGIVAGGWAMGRQALAASALRAAGSPDYDRSYCDAKIVTARFYADRILPEARALATVVTAGKATIFALTPEQLASS